MSNVFARAGVPRDLELAEFASQIEKNCSEFGYVEKYVPRRSDGEVSEFRYIDASVRSWSAVSSWFEPIGYGKYDRPDVATIRSLCTDITAVEEMARLVELAVEECFELCWTFLGCMKKLSPSTRYSTSLVLNSSEGLLQHRENNALPFQLRLAPASKLTKANKALIQTYWETAVQTFSCLEGAEIVTAPDSDRPLIRLADESTYHTIPRKGYDFYGIVVNLPSTELASQTLREMARFWESMSSKLKLVWHMPEMRLASERVGELAPRIYGVYPSFDFLFRGEYRKDFTFASLGEKYPPEGFWRLPLAVVNGNDSEDCEVYIDLVRTPNESFLEFTSSDRQYILNTVSKSDFADGLEFWTGPAHERWGLHELRSEENDDEVSKDQENNDMTIEDLDKIDILGTSEDGPLLIVVDPAALSDEMRLQALQLKLSTYRDAIATQEFQDKHPKWRNTKIKVSCAAEPTEAMRKLDSVLIDCVDPIKVPVVFETITPSFG